MHRTVSCASSLWRLGPPRLQPFLTPLRHAPKASFFTAQNFSLEEIKSLHYQRRRGLRRSSAAGPSGRISPAESKYPENAATTDASFSSHASQTVIPPDVDSEEKRQAKEITSLVDEQISNSSHGRLFAVVYINEKQFKLTAGDVFMVSNYDIGVPNGTQIFFDKVLLVGGRDFTLVGRPLLPCDLVRVTATVVERNISMMNVEVEMWRKLFQARTRFSRPKETSFRVNSIELLCPVEKTQDRTGFEVRKGDHPALM